MERKSGWKGKLRVAMAMIMAVSTPGVQSLVLFPLVLAPLATEADECVILNGTTTATCTGVAIAPKDSDLRQDAATTNSGAATTMHVQAGVGGIARRSIVQFDLTSSGIPTSAAVKTSFLRLFKSVAHASGTRFYQARLVTGATAWTEGGVTWNDRTTSTPWTAAGGDFNSSFINSQSISTPATGTVTWTIRSDATVGNIPQGWLDGTVPNNGVVIRDSADSPGAGAAQTSQFVTQQGATTTQRPTYELRYLRDVTLNSPTVGVSEVTWTWTFPSGSTSLNYNGVAFLRKEGSGASFLFTPLDGVIYDAGTDLGNSEVVAANTSSFATVTVTDENGADNVILPATAYTYKAIIHDNNTITGAAVTAAPHYSFGVSMDATTTSGGGANKNWSYKTAASSLSAPALDPGNVVLTGSNDNLLHSMDATSGGRKYQPLAGFGVGDTIGPVQSRPVLIPLGFGTASTATFCGCDVAYVASERNTLVPVGGRVRAFDAATGAQLWESVDLGDDIIGSPSVQLAGFSNGSYPHAFDLVIVGTRNTAPDTTNNKIYGLNGNDGSIVWTFAPGNLDIISSTPILDYSTNSAWFTSRAGVGGTQPSLWKMDTSTTNVAGNLLDSVVLGSLGIGNRDIDASPDFNQQTTYLFAVTTTGDLVAVDHTTPANVFTTNVTGSGMGFPIVQAGSGPNDVDLYFTTSTGVHKQTFDTSNQTFTTGWFTNLVTLGGAPSAPMFTFEGSSNPFIYVGIAGGVNGAFLKKLATSDGTVDGTIRTINSSSGVVPGDPSFDTVLLKFFIGDTSGRIYSFDKF